MQQIFEMQLPKVWTKTVTANSFSTSRLFNKAVLISSLGSLCSWLWFLQTKNCTRVRLQVFNKFGKIKMDMPYGAVIYGMVVGPIDQIIVSGGQVGEKNIDVIWKDGQQVCHRS